MTFIVEITVIGVLHLLWNRLGTFLPLTNAAKYVALFETIKSWRLCYCIFVKPCIGILHAI